MNTRHIAIGVIGVAAISAALKYSEPDLAETVEGGKIRVVDGDTVAIGKTRIRLMGIDTAEIHEPRCPSEKLAGEIAKLALEDLLKGKTVTILSDGADRYGRTLARLKVDGRDVGQTLINKGYAIEWRPGEAAYAARQKHWCGT